MKKDLIHNNLNEMLSSRNWKLSQSNGKYDIYLPPIELDFDKSFKFYVYKRFDFSDYEKETINSLNLISELYNEDIDELVSIIVEDRQILSIHIDSKGINDARPRLPFFNNLISKSKDLLQEVANYSVLKKAHFFDNLEESERYLNYCNFLKNDVGSLITKIQLPNKEEIRFESLFEKSINADEINKNIIKIAGFINNDIIAQNNYEPTDEFLLENQEKVSVNVTNKLKDLYIGIDLSDIDITLKGTNIIETTSAKNLNREKVNNLNTFSKTVREKMKEITSQKISGKIVELRSKDVDKDNNTVELECDINRVKSRIIVKLNSGQIKLAAEAFKNNRTIELDATLEKGKSHYLATKLNNFSFEE